ncbi:hypothetical protein MauCBS54593_005628 [Microsporum audouinii]
MLAEVALKLESRIRALEGTNTVIRLDHAFSAFSGDIIGKICLDSGDESKTFLSHPTFNPECGTRYDTIHTIVRSIPLFTAFPWIVQVVSFIPESILLRAFPRGQMFNNFKDVAKQHIYRALRDTEESKKTGKKDTHHASLFHYIATSDMPESERSPERLAKEAQVLLGGGTASTARTIGFTAFYIMSVPEIRSRLEDELRDVMADWPQRIPSWAELEKLPFLQALIKESLRLSYGVMHRLPRISPDVPIQYKQYSIPPGVPVGMSAYFMHSDANAFPEPDKYIPDRWLGKITPETHRSYVPFTRGSRNCLGMNLAMSEMSLILAVLFRPHGPKFELFGTDESDVKQAHDFLIPLPKIDTKGVRAIIR